MLPLKTQAIQIALTGNWEKAAKLNIEILKQDPNDTEALNRLAFALTALGNNKEAKEAYERVLSIDQLNPIATRGLRKLSSAGSRSSVMPKNLVSNMFLEESGKTKIVNLVNIAPLKILRTLQVGQDVALIKKRNKIFVQDGGKLFIGILPEDLGKRLIKFMEGGNAYTAYIKAATDHSVTIFMKETKRAARFKNQPSFLFGDKTHLTLHKTVKNQDEDLG